jgi:hypothetical protein
MPTERDLNKLTGQEDWSDEEAYIKNAFLGKDHDQFKDKSSEELLEFLANEIDSVDGDKVNIKGVGKFSIKALGLEKEVYTEEVKNLQKQCGDQEKKVKDEEAKDSVKQAKVRANQLASLKEKKEDFDKAQAGDKTDKVSALKNKIKECDPAIDISAGDVATIWSRVTSAFPDSPDALKDLNNYNKDLTDLKKKLSALQKDALKVLKDAKLLGEKAVGSKNAADSVKLSSTRIASVNPFVRFTFFDVDGFSLFVKGGIVGSATKYSIQDYKKTKDGKELQENTERSTEMVMSIGGEAALGGSYKASDSLFLGFSVYGGHRDAFIVHGADKNKEVELKDSAGKAKDKVKVKDTFADGLHFGASLSAGIVL